MTQSTDPVNWQEVADAFSELMETAEAEFQSFLNNATYTRAGWYTEQTEQHQALMARYRQILAKIIEQI